MQEKDMVMDVLNGTKAGLGTYAKAISDCGNLNLRQTFQQMRDSDEKFQFDLLHLAQQKGYTMSAPMASEVDTVSVKAMLTESATMQQGGGPVPSSM